MTNSTTTANIISNNLNTSTSDSQTGFMKILNQAKQINFIFYIISGIIVIICRVSICCLYYFYYTRKAARKLKKLNKLNIVLPKSAVPPSITNNNTIPTESAQSPVSPSQNSETTNIKSKSNELVVERRQMSVKSRSGIDYNYNNYNNKFVVNHNVNNNNYTPQKWQQMKYMQTHQQIYVPQIQHYEQKKLLQNPSYQLQPSHRNTVNISNVKYNNWNDNRNAMDHPHGNTVALTSNIYNNNTYDNGLNIQYRPNMHINVILPVPQQSNNNIPPSPPIPIKPNEQNKHISTTHVAANDDNASDITHITSLTFATLNTEYFENGNSQSVSSSQTDNNHITQQTNATIDTRQMTYVTHNIIEVLDNELDDEKKYIIEHSEGNITKHISHNSSKSLGTFLTIFFAIYLK